MKPKKRFSNCSNTFNTVALYSGKQILFYLILLNDKKFALRVTNMKRPAPNLERIMIQEMVST